MERPRDEIYIFINNLSYIIVTAQFIVSIVGLLVIIPHLFIITRKSKRTSSTNSLIIGIALCDLIVISSVICDRIVPRSGVDPCRNYNSYVSLVYYISFYFCLETFTRSSYYIGLSLALIRVLVISFPMNTTISSLTKKPIGYLLMLLMIFINFLPSANFYFRSKINPHGNWKPPKECPEYPSNYTENANKLVMASIAQFNVYRLACGALQITICVIYPILAILLLIQMRKVAKRVANLSRQSSSDKGKTSKMILLLTISYVISSAPIGINFLIRQYASSFSVLELVIGVSTLIESMLFIINGSVHCLICLIMSSDYQKTVKGLLRIREKENSIKVNSIGTK